MYTHTYTYEYEHELADQGLRSQELARLQKTAGNGQLAKAKRSSGFAPKDLGKVIRLLVACGS